MPLSAVPFACRMRAARVLHPPQETGGIGERDGAAETLVTVAAMRPTDPVREVSTAGMAMS